MKYKKSLFGLSFTTIILISIAFLMVAVPIILKLAGVIETGYDKQLCKISVVANSRLRDPGLQIEQVKTTCPIRFVTIGRDEILIESKTSKRTIDINCEEGFIFTKGTDNTDYGKKCFLNTTNKVLANLIFDCWDQFGAGNLQVFSRYDNRRQCLVCSRVEFKKEVNDLFGFGANQISQTEFKDDYTLESYMRTNKAPLHQITYYEFSLDRTDAFLYPHYDYSFDKPWAAVFVALNENEIQSIAGKTWEFFKEWWTDKKIEDKKRFVNTLEWVPYEEVTSKCGTLN